MRTLAAMCVVLSVLGLMATGCTKKAGMSTSPDSGDCAAKIVLTDAEKGLPFGMAGAAASKPVIDGTIEGAWGKPIGGAFVDTATGEAVKWQTDVWVAYDATNLYLAAKMTEPRMDAVIAFETDRDGDVWEDDAVEIFLDPTNTRAEDVYYHIMVNSLGTVADRQGAPDSMGPDFAWDAEGIVAAAAKGDGFWSVELMVPLAEINAAGPLAGKKWAMNFCRTRFGNDYESVWSNTGAETFQRPDKFGVVGFK